MQKYYFSKKPNLRNHMSNILAHSVYFWLKEDLTAAEHATFVAGVKSLLTTPGVVFGHVGVPAPTDRPVIDRSYSYNLVLMFDSQQSQDTYQDNDPNHQRFIDTCKTFWSKVLIYDSIQG